MIRSCGHKFLELAGQCQQCDAEVAATTQYVTLKDSNPKDDAATTRLDLSLFPATARAYGALAFTEGHGKYGGFNYREVGVRASIYYAAANRHLDKWFNGQTSDPKTGVPHLASALACTAVLIDAVELAKLNDDRPPRCNMDNILEWAEQRVIRLQELFPDGPPRYTHENTRNPEKKDQ